MVSFVARYDLRAPGATPAERHELYIRAVEQAAYHVAVEALGLAPVPARCGCGSPGQGRACACGSSR